MYVCIYVLLFIIKNHNQVWSTFAPFSENTDAVIDMKQLLLIFGQSLKSCQLTAWIILWDVDLPWNEPSCRCPPHPFSPKRDCKNVEWMTCTLCIQWPEKLDWPLRLLKRSPPTVRGVALWCWGRFWAENKQYSEIYTQ